MEQASNLSWLEAVAWVATVVAAVVAAFALRRQSLQNRAALLHQIYERWIALAQNRNAFSTFFWTKIKDLNQKHANLKTIAAIPRIRESFCEELKSIKDDDPDIFKKYVEYVSFFELIGVYVRNRYLPICDVIDVYKGPILDIELAFRDFIDHWQDEEGVPEGLFANAIYLMKWVRFWNEHPRLYWL